MEMIVALARTDVKFAVTNLVSTPSPGRERG